MKYKHTINNDIVEYGQMIVLNGTLCNPSVGELINAGYTLMEDCREDVVYESNVIIAAIRQEQYKLRSDSLYMSFQKYIAQGFTEKAEASRLAWLAEVSLIDSENPYNE